MANLEDAIALAVESHRGQTDKAGQPYILHPLRMMMKVEGERAKMVAVLHDVVEDCEVSLSLLQEMGFPAEVVRAVDAVTRRESESYAEFCRRAGADPLARVVKMADLEDNMNLLRLDRVTEKSLERLQRYHAAWHELHSLG